MKTSILILIFFILCYNLQTQWLFKEINASSSFAALPINSQFINPNTGFVLFKIQNYINSPIDWRIMKTTNKGNNWEQVFNVNSTDDLSWADISFININTGFLVYREHNVAIRTYYTTNSGLNWNGPNTQFGLPISYTHIDFINESTGYLYSRGSGNLYKTINKGANWDLKYSFSQGGIWDLAISPSNNNIVYMGGHRYGPGQYYNSPPFLVKSVDGFNTSTVILDGNISPSFMNSILKIFIINVNGFNEIKLGCYKGIKKLIDDYGNLESIYDYPEDMRGWANFNLQFSSNKIGYGYWGFQTFYGNKVIKTTDGGISWFHEIDWSEPFNSNLKDFNVIGDMCFLPLWDDVLLQKHLIINFNIINDWINNVNGSILINNLDNFGVRTINTPSYNQYLAGGTAYLSVPDWDIYKNDSTLRFYFWGGDNGNFSLNPSGNLFNYFIDGSINADYKTKLKSTTENALKNTNQVNILKDTNGVTNLAYESMGGIFYTRTKPDGNFKAEEIISGTNGSSQYGYATFNNSNPFIAELKPYLFSTPNPPEKNVWVCWERREGNNIKIMVSARSLDPLNRPEWFVNEYATITDAPADFKAFPKLVITGNIQYNTRVLTYLKPVSGTTNKKLAGKVFYNNNPNVQEFEIVAPANIQEYAMTSITNDGINGGANIFNLYLTYRINQTVLYKQIKLGWDQLVSLPYYSVVGNEQVISNDNSRWRASLDISLKNSANITGTFNMQPVVTYQGRYDVRILIDDEDGPPIEQQGAYYPIYVKEKLSNGSWSSSVISYNSPLNTVQMNPNIEGSKHMNSCILDYARGSAAPYTFYKVVPRWNGQTNSGYGITPTSYIGTDAKFIKSGLINNSSTSHKLMTLSSAGGSLYNLGTQSFSITNETQGDDNFVSLYGMVEANDVQYTFNLGNILVNSRNIGFDTDIDTVIDNLGQLNSNLVSTSFLLNENDTLIIGRNAAYVLNDPNGAPINIEYQVKLMNKTTSSMHRLLAHDTLNVADSVIYEFLEGYVIRNIPNGSDSFYVQLEIDTVDGDYGIGGGIGGDGEGGDSPNGGIKKKIFWEDEKLTLKENNLPKEFALYQNFPNPFNPVTMIKYDLPKDVNVTVKIYDMLGREVAVLVNNELKKAGRYELNWNAGNYASGVYIYRIEAGSYVNSKKMVLVK